MNIPVTFAQHGGADHFQVEVRVINTAAPAPAASAEQYRDRVVGLLRRCRLRLEQRRLEALLVGLR